MKPSRPSSSGILRSLARYESRNVTFQSPDHTWPIVWNRASGVHVWDLEGRKYLDLTSAFGVASAGHAHPAIIRAGQIQLAKLPHAMGDVHPHPLKAELCSALSRITFGRWARSAARQPASNPQSNSPSYGKVILGSSGFEAVEASLKTALLATGRPGVIAFNGAYHGLGYGALNATHRDHFRTRFTKQLGGFAEFAPFPDSTQPNAAINADRSLSWIRSRLKRGNTGAVLVEPIQARGGIRTPVLGFLPALAKLCREYGTLLILDEIYTGFGRTGDWFACEHEQVIPDLICLGKALAGGFPISACVGRPDVMDAAWPPSDGEAIHTSTFLGHPVGCAMALASIQVHRKENLSRSARIASTHLFKTLNSWPARFPELQPVPRGRGLLAGIEFRSLTTVSVMPLVQTLLGRALILLPEGAHGEVLALTPPLTIGLPQLRQALRIIEDTLPTFYPSYSG